MKIDVVVVVVVVLFNWVFGFFAAAAAPPAGRKPGPEPIGGAAAPRNSADRAKITLLAIIHIHVF